MQIFGNIEALKEAISKKHSAKIKQAEEEKNKKLAEIARELHKRLELLRSHMKTIEDAEIKKARSMILSEEKLKLKKEFEEKREALIEAVFSEAEKRAKKTAHTKGYIDFVKKNMPNEEKLSVSGDSDSYKSFFPKLRIDEKLIGLRFETEQAIYDFTIDSLIASNKEILRHEVSKVLFS